MRKFYKTVEAGTAPGGYVVRLDGKPLKTPLNNLLLLSSHTLASAIAQEWAGQGEDLTPHAMPFTQLANTMIDKGKGEARAEMNAQVLRFGGSDLVCYFATHPADLVRRHRQHWSPLIAWMLEKYGIKLETVSGIQYHHQPPEALSQLQKRIESLNAADFMVVQAAAAATGSVVIALALLEKEISTEEAYQAACVDEIYQLETWGEDAEARQKLEAIKTELNVIASFRDMIA